MIATVPAAPAPDGLEVLSINKKTEVFKLGETDDDQRFGMLSFGFMQAQGGGNG